MRQGKRENKQDETKKTEKKKKNAEEG